MDETFRLIKREKNFLKAELVGEDHTVANLIAKYAIRHPDVTYAAYNIEHPLISNPVIILRTRSRDALEVLQEVIRKALEDLDRVEEELRKQLPVEE